MSAIPEDDDCLKGDHGPVDPDAVHDRESFLIFVDRLAAHRRASALADSADPSDEFMPAAGGWENVTIDGFLEAAIAWADDSGNVGGGLPAEPSWRAFADFLYAGKIYE